MLTNKVQKVCGFVLWWQRNAVRILCASAIALQVSGVDAAATGVTVTPIGYDTTSPDPSIAWVDNNQVLFIGKKSNSDPKKPSFAPGKLYLWNEATKSVREHGEAISFCYSDGWIRYGAGKKDEAGNRIVYAGQLGKEEVVKVLAAPSTRQRASNAFSCKPYFPDEFVPPLPKDHRFLVLREGDGYLRLGPQEPKDFNREPKNVILYREKGGVSVKLPITWDEDISGWGTTYSDYKRAYVLLPFNLIPPKPGGNWPSTEPRIVYVLHASDGKVERVTIPPTYPFRVPRPTKAGWIYGGGVVSDRRSAGLYVYDGKKQMKIEAGGISAIVVSPDGCKAAVAINNLPGITFTSIKIFNFCAAEK